MSHRAELKSASLRRILDAAAMRLRREGLAGAAIAPVMQDAGLTHGAFYSHFDNKNALAEAAFRHALADNRPRWMGRTRDASWAGRLARLARRYLTPAHRDQPEAGCALAALASDAGRAEPGFRHAYQQELEKSLAAIRELRPGEPACRAEAIAFLALCVGGLSLARAVEDAAVSDEILEACRAAAARLGSDATPEDA